MSLRAVQDGRRERLHDIIARGNPITASALGRLVGTTRSTVMRWLRQDFPDIALEHFPTFDEILAANRSTKTTVAPVQISLPPPEFLSDD